MFIKYLQHKEKFLVLIILVFSLIINQYYANRGVFPIESFAHFDIAFRIINGDVSLKIIGWFQDYLLIIYKLFFSKYWDRIFRFIFFMLPCLIAY